MLINYPYKFRPTPVAVVYAHCGDSERSNFLNY